VSLPELVPVFDDAVIAAIGESEKSRARQDEPVYSLDEYIYRAVEETLSGTGFDHSDVDGFGLTSTLAETPGLYSLKVQETLGFEDMRWHVRGDAGGASVSQMLIQAALAVDAGLAETILCIGADTPLDPHSKDSHWEGGIEDTRGFERNYVDPFGGQGPISHIAHVQNVHMDEFGTSLESLGDIAITQREHATRNPLAYCDEPFDFETYRESTVIAEPMRLLDCVIPVNAGLGFVVTTPDQAADAGVDSPIYINGYGNSYNFDASTRPDMTRTGWSKAGPRAFEIAGVDPSDADFLQAYDDFPIIVLMQLEDLGFCEKGAGDAFVGNHSFRFDGDLPLNTGGGQLSAGQIGLAGGGIQILEAVRQLRGEAGRRQVPDPEWGIATGIGGISYDKTLEHFETFVFSTSSEVA
jgi:acetyl-CoA acetyltransferase